MPRIDWDESYSVNNAEIDDQHKKWIEITNKLHDALVEGHALELKKAHTETLAALKDYMERHFAFEEEFMHSFDYPDFTLHRLKHAKISEEINEYYEQMQQGKFVLNTSIMKTLINWLQDHIKVDDKKYSLYRAQIEK
jgi:hemerythrin